MRVADQVPPATTGHRPGPDVPMGQWPAGLVIAIEKTSSTFPRWDDLVADWDGGEASEVWDAGGSISSAYVDATCTMHGLEFSSATATPEGVFEGGELALTLDNRSGEWSQYSAGGQLTDYIPGRKIHVWATLEGAPWWLWSGVITAWQETGDTVEAEAFDPFTVLNQHVGKWTPGTAGQNVRQRITAILATIGYTGPTTLDQGAVNLLTQESGDTPLEAMQRAAVSDGGILFADADGTVTYRDRTWTAGRSDQPAVPVLSSNVCTSPVVVWDPVITTDDLGMVNVATLTNVATVPVKVTATNTNSRNLHGPITLPTERVSDLWTTSTEGQALADHYVASRGGAYLRLESAALFLHDRRSDLWRTGIDLRVGDVVEFLHDHPTPDGDHRLDLFLVITGLVHEVTPSSWVVTLTTTPVTGHRPLYEWDASPFTWDDPAPANAWSF